MTQRILSAVVISVVLGIASAPRAQAAAPRDSELLTKAAHAFNDLAKKAIPAVVSITTIKTLSAAESMSEMNKNATGGPFPFGTPVTPGSPGAPGAEPQAQQVVGIGSGIIIRPDGYILTNDHVVDHADRIQVSFDDKTKLPAHLVGTDNKTDLAVIQLDNPPKNLSTLSFADSEQIKVGDWAIAVGSPYGLKQSVTFGIVSAKGRQQMGILDIEDFIQTDAAINPGSSGGPLLNTNGDVIGVNTAIFSQGGGFSGIGFAVPAKIAKEISDQLVARGRVLRGWVGLFAQDLTEDLAKHFHSPSQQGALVSEVVSNGPAQKASLKAGDVVLKYNNQTVESASQLKSLVGKTRAGSTIPIEIAREGTVRTVDLPIQEQPGSKPPKQQAGRVPTLRDPSLGLVVEDIPVELSSYLRLSPHGGAIIVAVRPGSPAFDAGLSPGDVVLDVDKKEVHGAKEFSQVIGHLKASDTPVLYVQHGPDDKTFVPVKASS